MDSAPSFNQFYVDNKSRGLTSIIALHQVDQTNIAEWGEEYCSDVVLLEDEGNIVYDQYKIDNFRPQYIVIDRDMNVVFKSSMPSGKSEASAVVLDLLNNQ